MTQTAAPILRLTGIEKSFGATRALRGVDLSVLPGEVHAVIGENGAGKSTLMKALSGAHKIDAGSMEYNGAPYVVAGPNDARRKGVAMVYQELTLASHMTVEENITLGVERYGPLGFVRKQRDRIRKALEMLGHADLPLEAEAGSLSIGMQQVIEIARGLLLDAKVIILDEPTSSLTAADTRKLFDAIGRLRDNGIAVIYISHFLEEVFEISDSYTVLRDGQTVGSGSIADTSLEQIIEQMVGRTLDEMFPTIEHAIGGPLLTVEGLRAAPRPLGAGFELRAGEILGVAGLVGSGRSETVRALFGLLKTSGGRVVAHGRALNLAGWTPQRALRNRMDLLSEDRKEEGLAVEMSIAENIALSGMGRFAGADGWGLLSPRAVAERANHWIGQVGVKCAGPLAPVESMSGGNQQKVALARILQQNADIVMLDEPTRGVDVGSKVEIYRLIGRMAQEGKGIVFVSSYLPELFGVCDTIAVMHRGQLSAKRPTADWTENDIMRVATSGK